MFYYRIFSIIIIILFVFILKYFLMNLYLPVLVEYYREEYENSENSLVNKSGKEENENDEKLTWKESKLILIFICFFVVFFLIFK